jgi:hypothetical protein
MDGGTNDMAWHGRERREMGMEMDDVIYSSRGIRRIQVLFVYVLFLLV